MKTRNSPPLFNLLRLGGTAAVLFVSLGIGALFVFLVVRGAPSLNISLFFGNTPVFAGILGLRPVWDGIWPAAAGTLCLVLLTLSLAIFPGIGCGIFIAEYAKSRARRAVGIIVDILAGTPSIVVGLFGFTFILFLRRTLLPAANTCLTLSAFCLALLVLPVLIVNTREALLALPDDLRLSCAALGFTKGQALRSMLLPAARGGLWRGIALATGRAAEDTAVIMLTGVVANSGLPAGLAAKFEALPFYIYYVASQYRNSAELGRGFAAALILLCLSAAMVAMTHLLETGMKKARGFGLVGRSNKDSSLLQRASILPSSAVPSTSRSPQGSQGSASKTPPSLSPVNAVHIDRLSVSFDGRFALREASAIFPASGISVIIGRSGSGKTTLLRAINRLNEEFSGCVTTGRVSVNFGAEPLSIYDSACGLPLLELRRRVGMLFQTPNLFPTSIYRNLAIPLHIAAGCAEKEKHGKIESALVSVGLWDEVKDRLDMPARRLSGGQQQRLCLARTLSLEPSLLLLDEPTASLDVHAARNIEDLLLQLAASYPVIMVSHSLSQARRLGDKIFICESGQLGAELTSAGAISDKLLERLL
ncbi:MAG: ATP-binding cassette domain-containing protein [Spirochaetaceae bacterium]|nr:ATP-binding cassette domain-containing protein [Spirochaetaceae bacterium]